MYAAIIAFIKTHVIASIITAVTVVGVSTGAVIVVPIVVENKKLDDMVKDNIGLLVTSTTPIVGENNEIVKNEIVEDNKQDEDKPLTFKVEKVVIKDDSAMVMTEVTIDGQETTSQEEPVTSTMVGYGIVPSYDKPFDKWTKEEKEAYAKCLEEEKRLAEEEYQKTKQSEEQTMAEIEKKMQEIMEKDWHTQNFEGAGSIEYNPSIAKIKGTIVGISFDTTYQDFINNFASNIQSKLDARCPVPKNPEGSYEGLTEDGFNRMDAAHSFEYFAKEINDKVILLNTPNGN